MKRTSNKTPRIQPSGCIITSAGLRSCITWTSCCAFVLYCFSFSPLILLCSHPLLGCNEAVAHTDDAGAENHSYGLRSLQSLSFSFTRVVLPSSRSRPLPQLSVHFLSFPILCLSFFPLGGNAASGFYFNLIFTFIATAFFKLQLLVL